MRMHSKQKHGLSAQARKGRPSKISTLNPTPKPWRILTCQRFIVQGQGSHFIEIVNAGSTSRTDARVEMNVQGQARQTMHQAMRAVKEKERMMIQEGEITEVNPCLERTGWLPYLTGFERPALMTIVAQPDKAEEPSISEMWTSFDRMIRDCQQTIISRAGIFVRMEAVRKDNSSQEYTPLQSFMDTQSIQDHSRPWKQVLMFFARARPPGSESSQPYRFTPAQKRAWRRFCAAIERAIEDNEFGEEVESISSAVEIPDGEATDRSVHEEAELNQVDKSCLNFCIELLDQRITRTEYESPLVNALAVLGVEEDRWLGLDRYPPILSRMIKLARMIVVQHAWENSNEDEQANTSGSVSQMRELLSNESDHDEENESEPEGFVTEGTGFLERVRDMMNRFMIRGSHSPMQ